MITYLTTSIFDSPAHTLVNPVNTVGVMGAGLAKKFKVKFPRMFSFYRKLCYSDYFDIGKVVIFYGEEKNIILFPTKKHWKDNSKLEYIESGLIKIENFYPEIEEGISFPKLGCGLGGLDWNDVKPLMEKYLSKLNVDVYIHI